MIEMSLSCVLKQKRGCRNICKVLISNVKGVGQAINAHTTWKNHMDQQTLN